MSILSASAATTTTAPSTADELLASAIVLGPAMVIALLLAWVSGVFRRGSIVGPTRMGPMESPVPLLVVTLIAGGTWLMAQMVYGAYKGAQWHQAHPHEPFSIEKLSAEDIAIISTVPSSIAFILLLIGDMATRSELPRKLGYSLLRIPMGVLKGLLAAMIILPVVWSGTVGLEWLYRKLNIEHPQAHELLGVMRDAPQMVKYLLIFGACAAAPVFEEFLFRGHIQTLLVRLFVRPREVMPEVAPLAYVLPGGLPLQDLMPPPSIPPIDYRSSPTPNRPPMSMRVLTLLAVIITSTLFAAVHPLWMAPIIFVLSMCLGFAYEKTGNLWVPITVHAIFNTTSTVVYLNFT